jgi:hypothetical protein
MFDPKHLSEFIKHVKDILEKQDVYTVASKLNEAELVELSKHFTISKTENFLHLPKYTFTKNAGISRD